MTVITERQRRLQAKYEAMRKEIASGRNIPTFTMYPPVVTVTGKPKRERRPPRLDPVKSAAKVIAKNPDLVARFKPGGEFEIVNKAALGDEVVTPLTAEELRKLI